MPRYLKKIFLLSFCFYNCKDIIPEESIKIKGQKVFNDVFKNMSNGNLDELKKYKLTLKKSFWIKKNDKLKERSSFLTIAIERGYELNVIKFLIEEKKLKKFHPLIVPIDGTVEKGHHRSICLKNCSLETYLYLKKKFGKALYFHSNSLRYPLDNFQQFEFIKNKWNDSDNFWKLIFEIPFEINYYRNLKFKKIIELFGLNNIPFEVLITYFLHKKKINIDKFKILVDKCQDKTGTLTYFLIYRIYKYTAYEPQSQSDFDTITDFIKIDFFSELLDFRALVCASLYFCEFSFFIYVKEYLDKLNKKIPLILNLTREIYKSSLTKSYTPNKFSCISSKLRTFVSAKQIKTISNIDHEFVCTGLDGIYNICLCLKKNDLIKEIYALLEEDLFKECYVCYNQKFIILLDMLEKSNFEFDYASILKKVKRNNKRSHCDPFYNNLVKFLKDKIVDNLINKKDHNKLMHKPEQKEDLDNQNNDLICPKRKLSMSEYFSKEELGHLKQFLNQKSLENRYNRFLNKNPILKHFDALLQSSLNNTLFSFRVISSGLLKKNRSVVTNLLNDTASEISGLTISRILKVSNFPFSKMFSVGINTMITIKQANKVHNIATYFKNTQQQTEALKSLVRNFTLNKENQKKIIGKSKDKLKFDEKIENASAYLTRSINNPIKLFIEKINYKILFLLAFRKSETIKQKYKLSEFYEQKDLKIISRFLCEFRDLKVEEYFDKNLQHIIQNGIETIPYQIIGSNILY